MLKYDKPPATSTPFPQRMDNTLSDNNIAEKNKTNQKEDDYRKYEEGGEDGYIYLNGVAANSFKTNIIMEYMGHQMMTK